MQRLPHSTGLAMTPLIRFVSAFFFCIACMLVSSRTHAEMPSTPIHCSQAAPESPNDNAGAPDVIAFFACGLHRPSSPPGINKSTTQALNLQTISINAEASTLESSWTEIPVSRRQIGKINYSSTVATNRAHANNLGQSTAVIAGEKFTLIMSMAGLRVMNNQSEQWGFSPVISANNVRAHNMMPDETHNAFWLYGMGLFELDIATGNIFSYQPKGQSLGIIQTISGNGPELWIAAENGLFMLNKISRKLFYITSLSNQNPGLTSLSLQENNGVSSAWALCSSSCVMRILSHPQEGLRITRYALPGQWRLSDPIMHNGSLWLLASQNAGKSFYLSQLNDQDGRLVFKTSKIKLFSLKQTGAKLLGSAYENMYYIDTVSAQANLLSGDIATDGATALGKRILFTGASYVHSEGTAAATRYIMDISKGWQSPSHILAYEGWASKQPMNMFDYLPSVFDYSSNSHNIWLLLSLGRNVGSNTIIPARYDRIKNQFHIYRLKQTSIDINSPFYLTKETVIVPNKGPYE